jgi:hypothetical protein
MSTANEIQATWDNATSIMELVQKQVSEEIRASMDRELMWQIILTSSPGWTYVKLSDRKGLKWKEVADWMIENFGLPRSKFELPTDIRTGKMDTDHNKEGVYFTNATHDTLHLLFKNEKDAIMTILRWK